MGPRIKAESDWYWCDDLLIYDHTVLLNYLRYR